MRELRELFEKYGRVLDVKTGQAGFAFVEMEEERDCYECIRGLDDTILDGQRIMVEKAREKSHHDGHYYFFFLSFITSYFIYHTITPHIQTLVTTHANS